MNALQDLYNVTGIARLGCGEVVMIAIGLLLIWVAVKKRVQPLFLFPLGFGVILGNMQAHTLGLVGLQGGWGFFGSLQGLLTNDILVPLVLLGFGALLDFSPLIAKPRLILLGLGAQAGIFATFLMAIILSICLPLFDLTLPGAAAVGMIGGGDIPVSIFLANHLAPEMLGSVALIVCGLLALLPMIQPPILRALTTPEERKIRMSAPRAVSRRARILFPLIVLLICGLMVPAALPLLGMLLLGNLIRETEALDALKKVITGPLLQGSFVLLGLCAGLETTGDRFLNVGLVAIFALGTFAFIISTAAGVLLAKGLNRLGGEKFNPLIGSAGVSALPLGARISQAEAARADSGNSVLIHAMGLNVAGVIGSALAAGVFLALLGWG